MPNHSVFTAINDIVVLHVDFDASLLFNFLCFSREIFGVAHHIMLLIFSQHNPAMDHMIQCSGTQLWDSFFTQLVPAGSQLCVKKSKQ